MANNVVLAATMATPLLAALYIVLSIFGLARAYYRNNQAYKSVSQMLDQSVELYRSLVPSCLNFAGAFIIATTGFIYHARQTSMCSPNTWYTINYVGIFVSVAFYQSAIAVTLTESLKSHYTLAIAGFITYPVAICLDTYICYRSTYRYVNDIIRQPVMIVKGIAATLAIVGDITILGSQVLPRVDTMDLAHNFADKYLFIGEITLISGIVMHTISLTPDVYFSYIG